MKLEWDGLDLECEAGNFCVEYTKVTKDGKESLDSAEVDEAGIDLWGW